MPNKYWEKRPWRVKIERYAGTRTVSRVQVIAAQPRVVTATTFKAHTDRAGRQVLDGIISSTDTKSAAVVADMGTPYAGVSAETLIAHADLCAAAPELYEALEEAHHVLWLDAVRFSVPSALLDKIKSALAKARGEKPDAQQ